MWQHCIMNWKATRIVFHKKRFKKFILLKKKKKTIFDYKIINLQKNTKKYSEKYILQNICKCMYMYTYTLLSTLSKICSIFNVNFRLAIELQSTYKITFKKISKKRRYIVSTLRELQQNITLLFTFHNSKCIQIKN